MTSRVATNSRVAVSVILQRTQACVLPSWSRIIMTVHQVLLSFFAHGRNILKKIKKILPHDCAIEYRGCADDKRSCPISIRHARRWSKTGDGAGGWMDGVGPKTQCISFYIPRSMFTAAFSSPSNLERAAKRSGQRSGAWRWPKGTGQRAEGQGSGQREGAKIEGQGGGQTGRGKGAEGPRGGGVVVTWPAPPWPATPGSPSPQCSKPARNQRDCEIC